MGGKPSKSTSADKRLTSNKLAAKAPAKSTTPAAPKFGSPAWNAKYGIGKKK